MTMTPIEVLRGSFKDREFLFGPLPGFRLDNVVAYEFALPDRFEPWPGRTLMERTFVLLDLGVSFSIPCWVRETRPDGTVVDRGLEGQDSWYVDLITVENQDNQYIFRDLYIDVLIPTDGRHYRMLDLDEYADAMSDGIVSLDVAIDGLRRWQQFLDRHLHADRWPPAVWSDFPPRAIRHLAELPSPFGDIVTAP